MKLTEIKTESQPLLTEEVSPEFAEMILNEQASGNVQEMDVDAYLVELDQMIDRMNANETEKQ